MGLKVEGSNPSIYPIIFFNNRSRPTAKHSINLNIAKLHVNIFKLKWIFYTLSLFISFLHKISHNTYCSFASTYTNLYTNTTFNHARYYKSLYRATPFHRVVNNSEPKLPVYYSTKNTLPTNLYYNGNYELTLFKYYIKYNLLGSPNKFSLDASWKNYYVSHIGESVSYISLRKVFRVWSSTYQLLFNIFFYNIKTVTFGNIFFKNEVNSLNWYLFNPDTAIFRYVYPFLTNRITRIFNAGWKVFHLLRQSGFNISFIIDLVFHKKTIYYLRRLSFTTIGLVPSNYNLLYLDCPILTTSDSFLNQLLFIRFLISCGRNAEFYRYTRFLGLWKSFNL